MGTRNQVYEAALRAAAVDHGLKGHWSPDEADRISDEVLTLIWRDAAARIMSQRERERFLALSLVDQQAYFPNDSFFSPTLFKAEFLALAKAEMGASVH